MNNFKLLFISVAAFVVIITSLFLYMNLFVIAPQWLQGLIAATLLFLFGCKLIKIARECKEIQRKETEVE